MEELWDIVFRHLHFHALASVRLLVTMRHLWVSKKHDLAYWQHMESILPHHSHYEAFRAMHKHMGTWRRVLAWASYCDSHCSMCKVPLFGLCTCTFAIQVKLCYKCKGSVLISEWEISRYMPHALVLALRTKLRYCWIPYPNGERVRHYRRQEVISFSSPASWASSAAAYRRP